MTPAEALYAAIENYVDAAVQYKAENPEPYIACRERMLEALEAATGYNPEAVITVVAGPVLSHPESEGT